MRQLYAEFARLGVRPDLGYSIPLGHEDRSPELAALTDGEPVILVEPGRWYVPAIARPLEIQGHRFWYGVIESRAAIHDLVPDQAAPPLQPDVVDGGCR
jgi:hypothetical protein